MIAACCDQIRAVGAKGAVPNPPLVPVQRCLQSELFFVNTPDFGRVISRAGGEVAHIWGEKDPGNIFCVGLELANRNELGNITVLNHAPDVAVPLVEVVRG